MFAYDKIKFAMLILCLAAIIISTLVPDSDIEIRSRINQCKNNVNLNYPNDTRAWYEINYNMGIYDMDIIYSCDIYRNLTFVGGYLIKTNS